MDEVQRADFTFLKGDIFAQDEAQTEAQCVGTGQRLHTLTFPFLKGGNLDELQGADGGTVHWYGPTSVTKQFAKFTLLNVGTGDDFRNLLRNCRLTGTVIL